MYKEILERLEGITKEEIIKKFNTLSEELSKDKFRHEFFILKMDVETRLLRSELYSDEFIDYMVDLLTSLYYKRLEEINSCELQGGFKELDKEDMKAELSLMLLKLSLVETNMNSLKDSMVELRNNLMDKEILKYRKEMGKSNE